MLDILNNAIKRPPAIQARQVLINSVMSLQMPLQVGGGLLSLVTIGTVVRVDASVLVDVVPHPHRALGHVTTDVTSADLG